MFKVDKNDTGVFIVDFVQVNTGMVYAFHFLAFNFDKWCILGPLLGQKRQLAENKKRHLVPFFIKGHIQNSKFS